jgi:hypothetical protein
VVRSPKRTCSFRRQDQTVFSYNWRILTMVYNTQNYWVSGLCPSSRILNTRKHNVSETGSVSVLRWRGDTPTLLRPLEKTNHNHLALYLPKEPNRVGVSSPPPLLTWRRKQTMFPKLCVFLHLEFGTLDESRSPVILSEFSYISHLPHTCYMSCPSPFNSWDRRNTIL